MSIEVPSDFVISDRLAGTSKKSEIEGIAKMQIDSGSEYLTTD